MHILEIFCVCFFFESIVPCFLFVCLFVLYCFTVTRMAHCCPCSCRRCFAWTSATLVSLNYLHYSGDVCQAKWKANWIALSYSHTQQEHRPEETYRHNQKHNKNLRFWNIPIFSFSCTISVDRGSSSSALLSKMSLWILDGLPFHGTVWSATPSCWQ